MSRILGAIGAVVLLAALASGCGGESADATPGGGAAEGDTTTLALVAYSTPREVYAQLTKDFATAEAGAGVSFQESYAASGEQSRAVAAGLPTSSRSRSSRTSRGWSTRASWTCPGARTSTAAW